MDLNYILSMAVRAGASDIHLKAGVPPVVRVRGRLRAMKNTARLTPEQVGRMAVSMMNNHHKQKFKEKLDTDLAYAAEGVGRFRGNVFQQRGVISIVLRAIPAEIKTFEELYLPAVLKRVALVERGLVLVTGTTGSGKSTTLAAMLQHINKHRYGHILTIEDPIEFLIPDGRCIINQREIGSDARSFADGLRAALRQDPDVILIGEMRDRETIETALLAAETGHLVFSTVHTLNATETINRIISVFEPHYQDHIRRQLAGTLQAAISQRLVPRKDRKGRVPAVELLRNTARIREMIVDPERTREIGDALAEGHNSYGMQTFDQSLMYLLRNDFIAYEEALRQTDNPDDFALRISGVEASGGEQWADFEDKQHSQRSQHKQHKPSAASDAGPKSGDFMIERF